MCRVAGVLTRRTLWAYRDYTHWTGGHGKLLDYIRHVQAHPRWQVRLLLSARSLALADNPFLHAAPLAERWEPTADDALLLGGMDWTVLGDAPLPSSVPVLNLVQGVRHAEAGSPLRGFLSRRALRVCVSTPVAAAIRATGEVHGPVQVIPAAVDRAMLAAMGRVAPQRQLFVDAVKQPALGRELAACLAPAVPDVDVLLERVPRPDYLRRMAQARAVVALPEPREGFYLPGIEAMAMGRALVQCDCVGSADYLRAGVNALVPRYAVPDIAQAALVLAADAELCARLGLAGTETAQAFDLPLERRRVHALLDTLDAQWEGA